jgi:hypothetical protein
MAHPSPVEHRAAGALEHLVHPGCLSPFGVKEPPSAPGSEANQAKLALCRCRWSTLSTAKRSDLALNFAKPVKSSSRAVLDGGFATVTAVLLQKQWFCLFLFISSESSKNHSKSQKNHKMKNSILLDST